MECEDKARKRRVAGQGSQPAYRRRAPGLDPADFNGEARTRRRMLKLFLLALVPWGWLGGRRAGAVDKAYPETIAALQYAQQRELLAHQRYVEFAGKANADGYKGVAYLFTAFAVSEGIHARNFERILKSLGASCDSTTPTVSMSDTKDNLITAANDEIDTIDNLYPETLKRLASENNTEAITYVRYALAAEKQHREMIQKVQRYTEGFFDRVVKAIDEITSHYFVCQVCGSTLKKIPPDVCPICKSPSSRYEKVEPPA